MNVKVNCLNLFFLLLYLIVIPNFEALGIINTLNQEILLFERGLNYEKYNCVEGFGETFEMESNI